MRLQFPVEALAASLYHARFVGLPAFAQTIRTRTVMRRPAPAECVVTAMFPQVWACGGLGFGGVSGQAITTAYTIAIRGPADDIAVYWDGQFAYLVPAGARQAALLEDLASGSTAAVAAAKRRYDSI